MVVTNKVYTPEMFVEALTGKCEIFDGKDPITQIHAFLKAEGIEAEGQEFWEINGKNCLGGLKLPDTKRSFKMMLKCFVLNTRNTLVSVIKNLKQSISVQNHIRI